MSVSKGVDYFIYADGNQSVTFSGPKVGSTLTRANNFSVNNLQIDSGNISGWFNYDGPFTWTALSGTTQLATQTNVIDSLTGNLASGTMTVMLNTPSIIDPTTNSAISYGFYDSGPGTSGLTNQDQSYVYCTRVLTTWMGDLVKQYPQAGQNPFYQFALPGAHDSGMCTMNTVLEVLNGPEGTALVGALGLAFPPLAAVTRAEAPIIILNAAITQKDSITTMLNLGCRYFDFRPGTMYPAILGFSGVRYHQHAVIPGYPYIQFLQDVLSWLSQSPSEIVVVSCNTQGFASSAMNPTPSELQDDLQTAIQNTSVTSIVTGDASSLAQSYNSLIQSNTRLIFLNQIPGAPEASKYDSYNSSYATLSPSPILQALGNMNTAGQAGYTYTVLQLQGTATAVSKVEALGLVSSSQTASPLMSTKALFDASTLPWVLQNANNNLKARQPIVLLNDFIDNATIDTAITLTMQRMGIVG
jgi:hypothetical protein